MEKAPIPEDEAGRLRALLELQILDTPPERFFDDCLALAANFCGVSKGAVTLIDAERQWFKAVFGRLPKETSRAVSFCGHAVYHDDVLVVRDARRDPRFADNPLVADGTVVFYAGVPLHSVDGQPLGTLCVINDRPHELTDEQLGALTVIARYVEEHLTLRLVSLRLAKTEAEDRAAARALAELDAKRRDVTAMLIHDLKNPLSAVTAIATMLEKHEDLPNGLRAAVQDLIVSTEVADMLITSALDVVRSEDATLSYDPSTFSLRREMDELVRRLRHLAAWKDQEIVLLDRRVADEVRADRVLVLRAVRNLLDNALKYGPRRKPIRVVLRDAGVVTRIDVEDEGPRVPTAIRERIFDKFYTASGAGERRGHGLGLALCTSVARAHGGEAWVEETPTGNRFSLTLGPGDSR